MKLRPLVLVVGAALSVTLVAGCGGELVGWRVVVGSGRRGAQ